MLVTISTTHRPATDLGWLLHKHPERVQDFPTSSGTATVFYPEANEEVCTAALLLEVDPVRLARSRTRTPDFALAQYVNDRSYAASSLLGVALADVFSTARAGVLRSNQALADAAIPLVIDFPVIACQGGADVARRLFEPLGWDVAAEPIPLDEQHPDWGDSRYLHLTLTGTMRLASALAQLHVLLPTLDATKHYWQGPDEVDKLMRSGAGWLAEHPERELITRRYLGHGALAREALERINVARLEELDDVPAVETEAAPSRLREQRWAAVHAALVALEAHSVIDLGCGPGAFLATLVPDGRFTRLTGTDVSSRSLATAERVLHLDRATQSQAARISLFQGALTYEDERFAGYDAAVLMEVIEHVDPPRLPALERVVFGVARPGAVVVTTPNREYNPLYDGVGHSRHADHRFEWDRSEFAEWAGRVGAAHGYSVARSGIGEPDPAAGHPTQMAVFTRD